MAATELDSLTSAVAERFGIDPARLTPGARFVEDLEFDSIQMLELSGMAGELGIIGWKMDVETVRTFQELHDLWDLAVRRENPEPLRLRVRSLAPSTTEIPRVDVSPPTDDLSSPLAIGNIILEPPDRTDVPFLYALATALETGRNWRFRGHIPALDQFSASLWERVLTQFVVRRQSNRDPIGQVVCYNPDPNNGFGYLGGVFLPRVEKSGAPIAAMNALVRHVFSNWTFRKLYMEVPEFNYPAIRSGVGRYFDVEGHLRNHDFSDGRYWDKYILSITRERAAGFGSQSTKNTLNGSRSADRS